MVKKRSDTVTRQKVRPRRLNSRSGLVKAQITPLFENAQNLKSNCIHFMSLPVFLCE